MRMHLSDSSKTAASGSVGFSFVEFNPIAAAKNAKKPTNAAPTPPTTTAGVEPATTSSALSSIA